MSTERAPSGRDPDDKGMKRTQIITADDLDTPYPYCLLPQTQARGRSLTVETVRGAIPRHGRTLLSVSTWDGRDILSVKSGE